MFRTYTPQRGSAQAPYRLKLWPDAAMITDGCELKEGMMKLHPRSGVDATV
jgi:hypothetical protein